MNILVNEIDDETQKKMHFVKMSVGKKKKVLMTLRALKKKKTRCCNSSLFSFLPSPLSSPTIPPTQQRKPTSNSPKHQQNERTKQKAANSW